jgi:hypothetical protein
VAVKGYDILIKDLNRVIGNEKVMIAAVNTVLAAQKKRIFQKGQASDESKIGTYSTKPISISKKNQSRNTGKTYFKGGYREYKGLTGKGSAFVNLRNTDQMMMDLGTTVVAKNQYGIGFSNALNGNKRDWMEEKYSKNIFNTTNKEDNLFVRVVEFELGKI